MTFLKKLPYLAVVLAAIPGTLLADAGYTSANFLKIGMGARAAGMADSFTAVADDPTAIYWNPAGLYQVEGTQLSLTHNAWLQGVNIEYLALSQKLGSAGAVGLGFTTLGLQSFLSTVEDSSGNFAGNGPSVSASDWELSAGYSNLLSRFLPDHRFDRTLVGLSVNVVGQNEVGLTGTAISFDAGIIQLFPQDHLSVGLDVVNVGTAIQDRSQPLEAKLGGAWYHLQNFTRQDKLTIAADLALNNDTGLQPSLGSEYRLPLDSSDIGFLRAGVRTTDNEFGLSFLTLGAGLEHVFSGFVADIDYAFAPYGTIGATHRISLNLRLGNEEEKINAQVAAPPRFNLDAPLVDIVLKDQASEPVEAWTLYINDEKGQLVQKVTGQGNPPLSYAWNAHNSAGALVAPGTYNATLEVKDLNQKSAKSNTVSFLAVPPLSLDNVQWTLSSDATFAIAQADLSPEGKAKLTKVGQGLKKYFGDIGVEVQGHTDNKPCRKGPHCKFNNNQELSEARAQTVKDLFVGLGLKPENVVIKGFAETVPVTTNDTLEGRSKNRRIQISIHSVRVETPESVSNAGIFLMEIGQSDQALQLFKLVSDHNPEKPEPYRLMAQAYMKMGNSQEAQKVSDAADRLSSKTTSGPKPTVQPSPATMATPQATMSPTPIPTATPTPVAVKPSISATPTVTPMAKVPATPIAVPTKPVVGSNGPQATPGK